MVGQRVSSFFFFLFYITPSLCFWLPLSFFLSLKLEHLHTYYERYIVSHFFFFFYASLLKTPIVWRQQRDALFACRVAYVSRTIERQQPFRCFAEGKVQHSEVVFTCGSLTSFFLSFFLFVCFLSSLFFSFRFLLSFHSLLLMTLKQVRRRVSN